ncbi:unnamed protein product [Macrosiphum euphorbiae]|uniref:LAGLIDADG homing endonuclease n=1 Tax=Macrosiphum euphorbiae TaxID=13131 RepID=A0AAV0Y3S9_9HEMI|nr:unnamed protein product [Macrosiphum euphorbiae]
MNENFKLVPLSGARSDIWQHFGFKVSEKGIILNKNQVFKKCKCAAGYSGNTTNLSFSSETLMEKLLEEEIF